jgi:hypothetical protein
MRTSFYYNSLFCVNIFIRSTTPETGSSDFREEPVATPMTLARKDGHVSFEGPQFNLPAVPIVRRRLVGFLSDAYLGNWHRSFWYGLATVNVCFSVHCLVCFHLFGSQSVLFLGLGARYLWARTFPPLHAVPHSAHISTCSLVGSHTKRLGDIACFVRDGFTCLCFRETHAPPAHCHCGYGVFNSQANSGLVWAISRRQRSRVSRNT